MKKHLTDGQLRAALDGELDDVETRHLESCADCQTRQRVLKAQVQRAAARLAFLAPASADPTPSAGSAWARFKREILTQKEISMYKRLFASPALRFGALAVLILALVVAFPTTRALASQLLDLFRIQQVTVLPVDFTGIQQLDGPISKQITQLISSSVTMTQKPGEAVEVADAAQAGKLTGYTVRLPQGLTPSSLLVMNASAFTFTIDRARAQGILDEAGHSDLVLPESVDGAEIYVNIPAVATADYGTCPKPRTDGSPDENGAGSPGRRYADCIIFTQLPSPVVNAPADVDVAQLAQIGLEFTGMSPDEAAAFTSTVDWTSTLVIPIPKNAATYQQVQVDGVTGTLIQRPSDDAPQFALLWVKNGIVYTISGLGSNSQQALDMANSLP